MVDVSPLDPAWAEQTAHGYVSREVMQAIVGSAIAATAPDGPTPAQRLVLEAVASMLVGASVSVDECEPESPEALAEIADRNRLCPEIRIAVVRYQALSALLLDPLPDGITARVQSYAKALGVADHFDCEVSQAGGEFANAALLDFARNGYSRSFVSGGFESSLHLGSRPSDDDNGENAADAWDVIDDDPELAERWRALAELEPGTLGRSVSDFYRSRAFKFPGTPDSAPPLLAQHDFVHVLADFGTRVESEIEVFALVSESDSDPNGFSLLAMILGLFETGAVPSAAGIFEADTGHLEEPGMAERLADALRRGMLAHRPDGSRDGGLLSVDFFAIAHLSVEEVRKLCNIVPKSRVALEMGSPGVWDLVGLSPYQLAHCNRDILGSHQTMSGSVTRMNDLDSIQPDVKPSGTGCVECEASGGWWFHLRRCATCGHIGCCDSSPSQHSTRHFEATGHPIIQSFEPGEDWLYDFNNGQMFQGVTLAAPDSHPADQPAPGPAGAVPADWRSQLH